MKPINFYGLVVSFLNVRHLCIKSLPKASMPATNHCDKEKWFQNCMIKHTKQSCPHDGQIREPWKRDPDREPVISKINYEKVKKVLAALGILLCASLCYT